MCFDDLTLVELMRAHSRQAVKNHMLPPAPPPSPRPLGVGVFSCFSSYVFPVCVGVSGHVETPLVPAF